MSANPLSIASPSVGVFMSDDVALFTDQSRAAGVSFVHSVSNLVIYERKYQTRPPFRELQLTDAPDGWLEAATQGAISYNPSIAVNPQNPTTGSNGVIESAAGKLYRITPDKFTFKVEDISGGITARPSMRLAWMCQAATYVIRTDGASPTQIWDGINTTTSTGYNPNSAPSSRLPNFAGPCVYAERIWIVNNNNEILAGDFIHHTDPVSNKDVLSMEQQSLDITSRSFPAPQELGEILSLNIVTTARGGLLPVQSEIVAGCTGPGMWGVLGGSPRSQWASLSMTRIVSPTVGPTGPYALSQGSEELLFRTNEGFTSIRYLQKEMAQPGNPVINLGQEIKPLLDRDPRDLLLYATVHSSATRQRLACSVYPMVDGAHRWHKGFVSASLSPGRTRSPESMVWEGVNTLPKSMCELIQFVEVKDQGRIRIMALLRKEDGTKTLAEWTNTWGDDKLADGTCKPIPWQILTRRLAPGGEYGKAGFGSVYLSLLNIRDKVDIRILARNSMSDPFRTVYGWNTFTNRQWMQPGDNFAGYADAEPIPLGAILSSFKDRPWVQLLIQGVGCAIVDVAIDSPNPGSPIANPSNTPTCIPGEALCQFDQFLRAD